MSAPRSRFSVWRVFAATSAISLLATASTIVLLYRAAYQEHVRDLERAADTLASFMESVAQFDRVFSADADPQGARGATLRQIAQGFAGVAGRSSSEGLVIGHRHGDLLRVLRAGPGGDFAVAADLELDGARARPLAEALAGLHGSGEFLDHRGVPVLAAYAPVPSLEIGLSYQTDVAAVRAPFVRAGLWAIGIYVLLAGLLTVGYWLLTRRLAERLAASTAHLSSIYDLAPVIMLTLNPGGELEQANPCFEKVTGYRLDEIKGAAWLAMVVPEHNRDVIREFLRTVADGASVHGSVHPILTRTGEERLIEWHAQPLRGDDGRVTGLLAAGMDVTERMRQEEKLRLGESAMASALAGMAMSSLDGKLFYVNAAWLEMHGYAADAAAVLGTTPFDHVENAADAAAIIAEMKANGQWHGELACRRRDGSIFPAELACSLVTDAAGQPSALLASFRDITERKRAHDLLAEKEAHLRAVVDGAFDGILMADVEMRRFTFANPAMCRMLGVTADELMTMRLADIHPPESLPEIERQFAAMARGELSSVHDAPLLRKDGGRRTVDISGSVIVLNGRRYNVGVFHDTTESHQAKLATQHERDRLRQILDAQFGFVAVLTLDGLVIEVNEAPLRLMRLNRADVLGRRFWDIGWLEAGETVARVQAMVAAAVRGETVRDDILARFPGVGVREVEAIFSPMRDAEGRVVSVVGFGVDITERKQAERELGRSEARYRHLHESMRDAFAQVDMEGNLVEWNRAYEVMLGYTPYDLQRLTYVDITPERWHAFEAGIVREQVLPRGFSDVYEKEYRRRDGTIFPVELRTFLLRDDAGAPVGMWAIVRDISERRQAEDALRASEERLNEAQRIARVGSWELNHAAGVLHWSDEIFRIFEIDPAKFGASYEAFLDTVHPEDREAVDTAFTASLRDRQPYRIVHRLQMADGRIKHVEEQCETDFTPDGRPVESRGTVQDVTERVIAEEKVHRSLREKETLLREVHHRVKNNLQVVSSMLFLDQRQAESPAVVAQFQRSRDRVAAISLVHEGLYQASDFGGINFGEYVGSLGHRILREFSSRAGSVVLQVEGAGFTLGVNEAVPCALIVNELLTNSLKHAFPHDRGGTITMRLETAADGTRHLWFGDSGVGVPGGAIPRHDRSLGMKLVDRLTEQLQATFVRAPAAEGILYHLAIPASAD